jgi:hypothetical protein
LSSPETTPSAPKCRCSTSMQRRQIVIASLADGIDTLGLGFAAGSTARSVVAGFHANSQSSSLRP